MLHTTNCLSSSNTTKHTCTALLKRAFLMYYFQTKYHINTTSSVIFAVAYYCVVCTSCRRRSSACAGQTELLIRILSYYCADVQNNEPTLDHVYPMHTRGQSSGIKSSSARKQQKRCEIL